MLLSVVLNKFTDLRPPEGAHITVFMPTKTLNGVKLPATPCADHFDEVDGIWGVDGYSEEELQQSWWMLTPVL